METSYRLRAERHGITVAEVARLDQVAGNATILDAACAARARGVTVERIVAELRKHGMDGAAQRLGQLRELNG